MKSFLPSIIHSLKTFSTTYSFLESKFRSSLLFISKRSLLNFSGLKENLGPGYEDLQVKDLNPKAFIKKHIGDVIDKSDLEVNIKSKPKIDPDIL